MRQAAVEVIKGEPMLPNSLFKHDPAHYHNAITVRVGDEASRSSVAFSTAFRRANITAPVFIPGWQLGLFGFGCSFLVKHGRRLSVVVD